MTTHICQNCGKEYPCPNPKECHLPKRFGHCSEKCKWENFGIVKITTNPTTAGEIIAVEYGELKKR